MSQNKTANEITCEFVLKCAQELGVELSVEDKSWTVFVDRRTQHKLCVSKAKSGTPNVDTTVDITALEGVLKRGEDAPENGRFVSLFAASAPLIKAALKQMGAPDCAPLRAAKRAARKAPVAFRLAGEEDASEAPKLHALSGLEA